MNLQYEESYVRKGGWLIAPVLLTLGSFHQTKVITHLATKPAWWN